MNLNIDLQQPSEMFPHGDRVYLKVFERDKIDKIITEKFDHEGLRIRLHPHVRDWCIQTLTGTETIPPSAYLRRHNRQSFQNSGGSLYYSIEFVTERDAALFKTFWL